MWSTVWWRRESGGRGALIGVLIYFVGISWSIAVVAIGPILGAALVMNYAPETRGLTLEQIQEQLDLEGELTGG